MNLTYPQSMNFLCVLLYMCYVMVSLHGPYSPLVVRVTSARMLCVLLYMCYVVGSLHGPHRALQIQAREHRLRSLQGGDPE